MAFLSWIGILLWAFTVLAAPLNVTEMSEWDARIMEVAPVSPLLRVEVSGYKSYTEMAHIAYCPIEKIRNWNCGESCRGVKDFKLYLVGGDGAATPVFFVGYHPKLNSVVVAHQGTDPFQLQSILVDANVFFDPLNPALHPGVSPKIKAHDGFTNAHDRSAKQILQAVKKAMLENNTNNVSLIGHSLGGALALLNGVYLKLNLPASISFKIVTYGQPRVGNQEFADYIDKTFGTAYTRITNSQDFIPIIPGIFLGFHHTATDSERHIDAATKNWAKCAGRENTSKSCTKGAVPNIFLGLVTDHFGPYDGIRLGSFWC